MQYSDIITSCSDLFYLLFCITFQLVGGRGGGEVLNIRI